MAFHDLRVVEISHCFEKLVPRTIVLLLDSVVLFRGDTAPLLS